MNTLFLKAVNISISASWLILAVLLFRTLFKKCPKWIRVLLWGMVAVRLACPFTIESRVSLIPSAQTIPERILYGPSFTIQTGITPVDERINDHLGSRYFEGITAEADHGLHVINVLAAVWIIGMILITACTAFSCLRLRRKFCTAVLLRDNIFQSEHAACPFVFGIFHPVIYIPFRMDPGNLKYVTAHEQAHIRRKDHWWKPLGFLLSAVYWFHPLVWLSYALLCRDIELACDEKVIKELETGQRAEYSRTLLECSASPQKIHACPLAFGETGVQERIKNILHYKKPAPGILTAAAASCIAIAVCFLTSPASAADNVSMVPSTSGMQGAFDRYLYVPLQGKTYRYESIDADTENVTKDALLDRFTEEADPDDVNWIVYSLKEYPDHSVVLALAGEDYKSLYQYSPSKRSDPDALQLAKKSGNIIIEDSDMTYGRQAWQDFLNAAAKKIPGSVTISYYDTLDPETCDAQYYKAYQEDYPVLYHYDLSYDGSSYTLHLKEGNTEYTKNYQYLMRYTGDPLSPYADYDSYATYVLVNDPDVTWEDIWQGEISSQYGDGIDHFSIYTELYP